MQAGLGQRGSSGLHNRLLNEVLLALGSRPDCRIWRNETGLAYRDNQAIRYGKKGSSDIIGLTSDGKLLCLEIKTGKAIQSERQVNFQKTVEKFGGRYFVIHTVDQARKILDDLSLPKVI